MGGTPPVLWTGRLRIRPRTMADLDACLAMDCEPGTLRWVDWPLASGGWDDPVAHRAFVESRIKGPYPDGLGYWVIARREQPDEFLGWVCLIPENARGPEVEIGWRLLRAARGRGYATEAAAALVRHGFQTVGLERIVAEMYRANRASNAVVRKLGFREGADPARTDPELAFWVRQRADWRSRALE